MDFLYESNLNFINDISQLAILDFDKYKKYISYLKRLLLVYSISPNDLDKINNLEKQLLKDFKDNKQWKN